MLNVNFLEVLTNKSQIEVNVTDYKGDWKKLKELRAKFSDFCFYRNDTKIYAWPIVKETDIILGLMLCGRSMAILFLFFKTFLSMCNSDFLKNFLSSIVFKVKSVLK